MEPGNVLCSWGPGRRRVTVHFDRSWVEERLASRRAVPLTSPDVGDIMREMGDHSLNTDMQPLRPLRPAAVLVPLVDHDGDMTVLFTQRTAHLAHHAGQISFPGGHLEPNDAGPTGTALRETEEEIGLSAQHVDIIGHLDTYVTRTGFVVTPVVGVVTPPFEVSPDAHEVADIFEVPLSHFLNPANHHRCSAEFDGVTRHFYAMPYEDRFIWGATAGMLVNMYDILTGKRP